VRRRRAGEKVGIAGVLLAAVGMTVMASAVVVGVGPIGAMFAGGQAVMIGVMLVCYAKLAERNRAENEAWKLAENIGYEKGHEKGYDEGFEEASTTRPVVVDLAARRCSCRTGKDASRAVELVDRV